MKKIRITTLLLFFIVGAFAQTATLEGYAYEEHNRGYLNLVKVTVLDNNSKAVVTTVYSNMEGFFTAELPLGKDYLLRAEKDVFKKQESVLSTKSVQPGDKVFTKIEMSRKPGYIFDVTMAEKRTKDEPVDAILGARVEIYNNTKKVEELVLENHPKPTFSLTFERGNHYTIMIRKEGYFTKRMEAYVDVEGCILCFDGIGQVRPGVTDNLAAGHEMGTLIANVELQKLQLNEAMKVDKIYYDYNSANIRKDAEEELDKIVTLMKDNPNLIIELGSHTDSRGSNPYNLKLSQERAKSAVNYITQVGLIDDTRIQPRGYGETKLTNKCKDGVKCNDAQHEANRRTELKVVGFIPGNNRSTKSLAEIIKEEEFERMLAEVQSSGEIKVAAGEELPDEIKNQESGKAKITSAKTKAIVTPVSKKLSDRPVATRDKTKTTAKDLLTEKPQKKKPIPKPKFESVVGKPKTEPLTDSTVRPVNAKSKIVREYEITSRIPLRGPNKLSKNYNGYRIEFYTSGFELPGSHEIFTQHGNITLEEKKDGSYAYLLGSFNDEKDANRFLNNVIKARYASAKVIRYQNGNRLLK